MNGESGKTIWNVAYTVLTLIIIALLTVFINRAVANTDKIQGIEIKQAVTETTVTRMASDINEIKNDVKTLVKRDQ